MKTAAKYELILVLTLLMFTLSLSFNLFAQDRGNYDHNNNGKHKGIYKKEERYRHDNRDKHYRRGDYYERKVRTVRRDENSYRRCRYNDRDYFFRDGRFYEMRDRNYIVVTPPIGIRINYLPTGYRVEYHGRIRYYFFGGIYYRFLPGIRMYVVVKAPI